MLIGPLAHIKRYDKVGNLIGFVIDWSRPGVIERFNAEESEWWSNDITNPRKSSNDHASWFQAS